MNNYELTLILNPALDEAGITNVLDKVGSIVTKSEGEIIKTDKWGLRTFAYSIRDQEKGYYFLLRLRATPDLVGELEKNLKLANDVLRFMFISSEVKEAPEQKQGD